MPLIFCQNYLKSVTKAKKIEEIMQKSSFVGQENKRTKVKKSQKVKIYLDKINCRMWENERYSNKLCICVGTGGICNWKRDLEAL